jgi:tetratricopeptide (TPR) repeat protein
MDKRLIELKEKSREAFKKNDFLKASLYIEEILGYSPNDVESYFLKANIFHLQGKMGKAISTFKKVIELDPKHTDAMISLSVLLNDIGKYEEAQKYFEMADAKVKKVITELLIITLTANFLCTISS